MCTRRNEREPRWSRTARWQAVAGGAGRARARATTPPAGATPCGHSVCSQLRSHSHFLGETNFTDTLCMVHPALPACCTRALSLQIDSRACYTHICRCSRLSHDLITPSTSDEGTWHCRHNAHAATFRQSTDRTTGCACQAVSRSTRCAHDAVRLGRASKGSPSDE